MKQVHHWLNLLVAIVLLSLAGTSTVFAAEAGLLIIKSRPIANDDYATTPLDTPVTIDVTANDVDRDGVIDVTTVEVLSEALNGSTSVDPDTGEVTYTPNTGFTGVDSFEYRVCDDDGLSDTAVVTVTVFSGQPPVAVDDEAETLKNTPVNVVVLDNDSDPDGDSLTVIGTSEPAHGSAPVNADWTVTYTPDDGFSGEDSFTYTISDGNGNTDTATVTVTVVNQPPVAVDDEAETLKNTPVDVAVLDNDSDPDDDILMVVDASDPVHGDVAVNVDWAVTYTPTVGFSGGDSFTYTISDGDGGTDTATVTVTVVNQSPVAVDDEAETLKNTPVNVVVLDNDSDPDGDSLTVVGTSEPAHGSAAVNVDWTVTYTPTADFSGEDNFIYTISDGDGGMDTATVTVTVVNQPPVAADDSAMTYKNEPVDVVVLDNDNDPDGDALTVVNTSDPVHGSAVVNVDWTVTYTPTAGFSGKDSFIYTISDGDGGMDTATVTVTVIAPAITIEKSVMNEDTIYSGDTVEFSIWVTNTGNVPLTNVKVTDALVPGCAADLGTLVVGQEEEYTCEHSSITESFTNTAMAEGTDPLEGKVQAQDSAEVEVVSIHPEISINKYVANEGAIYSGGTVIFNIVLENTGDVPLSDVAVTDPLAPDCSQSLDEPLPVNSDEPYSYYCQLENMTASFTNTASVQGTDPAGGIVTATDTADVNVIPFNPSLVITKSLVSEGGPISSGDDAAFRIEVRNTGDVELYNVEVTDAIADDCEKEIGTLLTGAGVEYYCVRENVTESFTNVATAVGTDPLGGTVTATDSVYVEVQGAGEEEPPDVDGDGIPDYQDNDWDNDGIPNDEEGDADSDGDGTLDYLDDDSDNDGIPDAEEGNTDSDRDGVPNYLDTDADNDTIPDEVEGTVDSDGDGIPDYVDLDSDSDDIPDEVEGVVDTDGDEIPNYIDKDSDGDGIPDEVEGVVDTDSDEIPNYVDEDSDTDGIPDEVEGIVDTDGDGIPNYLDSDADGDTISDALESAADTDGDGIPNYLDLDSDGDGIPDAVEGVVDTNGDGDADFVDEDSDDDGISDAVEGAGDTDTDGIPDYLDLDSDDDGIHDAEEGEEDRDGDGIPNYLDLDSDGDGILDAVENTGDADGDGVSDPDADGDGMPNYLDLDSDGDGRLDADEGTGDSDQDGIPNYLDPETISHTELRYRTFFPLVRVSAP